MPIISPMSPVRVVRNALSAASVFAPLLPPVADQHERAEADAFPADEQLQRVVGDDEQQHRRGEQAQHREVVGVADVVVHVRGRVDVHEQRDQRDDEEHHHDEAVDAGADAELDAAVLPPRDRAGSPASTTGSPCSPPSAPKHAAAERARPSRARRSRLDPVDPLDDRDARQHERRAERGDADLGALASAGACRRRG